MNIYIETGFKHLKKNGEELCGDTVKISKTEDFVVMVLSDGLGSGVKANILSTLTAEIALNMMKNELEIDEVVKTIIKTLPTCKVRNLAYSTFSILKIYKDGKGYLIEFDSPAALFLRTKKVRSIECKTRVIEDRTIKESRFDIREGDEIYLVSDGVIHAGVGNILNLGWQWENVANYLEKISNNNESTLYEKINILTTACNKLYGGKPGDDTTIAAVKIKKPEKVILFTGPPVSKEYDKMVADRIASFSGRKIVCGGTAANIIAREQKKELETSFEIHDPRVPPIGKIKGIDLVTEGVLTLSRAVEIMRNLLNSDYFYTKTLETNKDGASKLINLLIKKSTHVKFVIGRSVNPAHQNPDFPKDLSIKLNIINELIDLLKKVDKEVIIEYC